MARIRSVHPSLWTDEDFVQMSDRAQLFYIGLWGEADDFGIFEWKPIGLKMRLAPAANVDPAALLKELEDARFVIRMTRNERTIGVLRNFRKFQRPKNPSQPIVPIDDEIARVIALKGDSPTPALPQPYPSPTEIPPQMEDVGCRKKEGVASGTVVPVAAAQPDAFDGLEKRFADAMGELAPCDLVFGPVMDAIRSGVPENQLVAAMGAVQRARDPPNRPRTWKLLVKAAVEHIERQKAPSNAGHRKQSLSDLARDVSRQFAGDREPTDAPCGPYIVQLPAHRAG